MKKVILNCRYGNSMPKDTVEVDDKTADALVNRKLATLAPKSEPKSEPVPEQTEKVSKKSKKKDKGE